MNTLTSSSSLLANNHNANRLSLLFANQNEYDFFNAEKIHRSNSLKKKVLPSASRIEQDSVSESGFKQIKFSQFKFKKKQRSNSINISSNDLKDDILNFDGALFYLSNNKGLSGNLSVNSKKLVFTSGFFGLRYSHRLKQNFFKPRKPANPIEDAEDLKFYEIDLMNIAEISKETTNEQSVVYIHCRNFKHVKIGLKATSANSLYNTLIAGHQINFDSNKSRRSFLWEFLYDIYPYRLRSDWIKYEKWYINNFKIHFTQFNEIGICPSLPEIIIVPRNVQDQELNSIVNISDGQRVPVISYLYRQSGHMIIRSTSFNANRLSLHNLYKEKLFNENKFPLIEFQIQSILPSIEEIEQSHFKLRKTLQKTIKMNQTNSIATMFEINYSKQFWSKCSHWLCSLSNILKLVCNLVETISQTSSIGLIEKNDCNWNCLLSSLVQICIDPEKRTIKGFEPLISKEWLHLSGYKRLERSFGQNKLKTLNEPNHILFVLFLDAVHQLIVQHPRSFEFSTFYLILLLDYHVDSDLFTKDKSFEFELNKTHPLIYNPIFEPNQRILKMKTHVSQMRLFTKLFFRSLQPSYDRFTSIEHLFLITLNEQNLL
ncbi:Myotubularin-related protein 9 [Sarcoptes scabiei]|uniref:Myotubularin-related protein 9 n=1 Tax=Sarcoptes scabiei TaxID=52283 RepID=A0A834RC21_SARSC|nr:Myotubularin-related protein 9 [Sarcoptes scabiei]